MSILLKYKWFGKKPIFNDFEEYRVEKIMTIKPRKTKTWRGLKKESYIRLLNVGLSFSPKNREFSKKIYWHVFRTDDMRKWVKHVLFILHNYEYLCKRQGKKAIVPNYPRKVYTEPYHTVIFSRPYLFKNVRKREIYDWNLEEIYSSEWGNGAFIPTYKNYLKWRRNRLKDV